MDGKQISSGGMFASAGVGRSLRTYVPATFLYRGISFVRGLVLAWLLAGSAGQFALLAVATQVINILAPLVSLGINEAITRYAPQYEQRGRLRGFLRRSVVLLALIAGPSVAVLVVLAGPLGAMLFGSPEFDAVAAASLGRATAGAIGAIVVYFLVVSVLKGLRMFPALAAMEVVHGVLFLVVSLVAAWAVAPTAASVVWAYLVAMVVPSVIWGAFLRRGLPDGSAEGEAADAEGLGGKLLGFGTWAALSGIVWQAWQIYSLWYLAKLGFAAASDAFAGARLIGQVVIILAAAMTGIVTTAAFAAWESRSREEANALLGLYTKLALSGLLALSLVLVLADDLIVLVLPSEFAAAAEVLAEVVVFFQLTSALGFLAVHFALVEKTRLMLWSWLVGLGSNVALVIWLVRPEHPLSGAVLSAAISCLPAVAVCLVLVRAEGQPVSRGLVLLTAASLLLLLPDAAMVAGAAGLAVLGAATTVVFSREERIAIGNRIRQRVK